VLRFRLMGNEVREHGLKHQKEKRSMDHFAGLDVSVKETSICIVDDAGKIVREVKGRELRLPELSRRPGIVGRGWCHLSQR
jgi:hypothetical protein